MTYLINVLDLVVPTILVTFTTYDSYKEIIMPATEYLPLAKSLAIGRKFALSTMLIASLYTMMDRYVNVNPL
ncbi:conserved hypothetical protein [Ricinus communis]|uniref:Uncharacterized protein n=1 Tax=Ricinus communis TaxID=3988 RepID=B9SH37_RICCO|nr:conserved hypothetical protein [Ricinus communis]